MKKVLSFVICAIYVNLWTVGETANRMMYRPAFDFQNVPLESRPTLPFSNSKLTSNGIPTTSQQQIMHTGRILSQPLPTFEQYNVKNSNNNLDGIFQMVNEISDEERELNKSVHTAPRAEMAHYGYGLPAPTYGQMPEHEPEKGDTSLKPKSSLIESLTTKSESKVNGLISLVLALLSGSTQDNPFGRGIKDVIINGLVRPLLVAKGGIKMLISRLAIPVVSLLLINLEVLITVWWLWDDCPVSKAMQPTTPDQPNYNSYNNYNSSY